MTDVCDLEPFNYDTVPGPDDPSAVQLAQEQLQGWLGRFLSCVCDEVTDLQDQINNVGGGGGGGGAETFLELTDTPASYASQGSKLVAVNAGATALEFVDAASDDDGLTLDHSTSEQTTERTWFPANETIYQKSIDYGAMPNATTKNVAHGITNLDKIVRMDFWMKRDSDGTQAPLPLVNNTSLGAQIQVTANATNVSTRTSSNYSAWDGRLTMWYTRS